jgi:uncharacterized coiled-coil protein SlyX
MTDDEKTKAAEQRLIDAVCYYRNLAIGLGAKPETMLNYFDRQLVVDGVSLTECTPGYWSMVDSLEELSDQWRTIDTLRAQLAEAQAQVARIRALAEGWLKEDPLGWTDPAAIEAAQEEARMYLNALEVK